jgi:hypothetical protein
MGGHDGSAEFNKAALGRNRACADQFMGREFAYQRSQKCSIKMLDKKLLKIGIKRS